MNKTELAEAIAAKTGQTKTDSSAAVEALIETVTAELKKGEEVSLAGFGKFTVSNRAAREGRNPSTGEKIQIPASRAASFKALKALKEALN